MSISSTADPLVDLDDSDGEEERLMQELRALKLKKQKKAEKAQRLEALRKQIEAESAELGDETEPIKETRDAPEKSYTARLFEKRRGADAPYSPGYGVRGPNENSHLPLPPDEERVTEHGSIHRVYPAPAPLGEIKNADAGWDDYQTEPAPVKEAKESPDAPRERAQEDDGGWTDNINQGRRGQTRSLAEKRGHDVPPHLRVGEDVSAPSTTLQTPATGGGGYVAWEGVTYSNPDVFKDLEDEKFDIKNAFADKPDRDRMGPRSGGAGGYGGGGFGDRQQDSGYGSRNRSGGGGDGDAWGGGGGGDAWGSSKPSDGGAAPGWGDAVDSYGGAGGYGAGGNNDGCRICRDPGHWSKECPKKDQCLNCGEIGHRRSECDKGPKCRRCEQFGHMSYDCTEPRQPGSGGGGLRGECFNCGEAGHNRADCEKPVDESKFFGECHNCGERGHRSRFCTKEKSDGYSGGGGGFGGGAGGGVGNSYGGGGGWGGAADNGYGSRSSNKGDDSWGGGGGGDGNGAAADGDWGAPASGTAQSSNNDWGNPAPTRTADRNEDRNTHDDRRERYDERSNANSDTRSREGSVQVDGQAKARVAAAIGMNPERMRMAGMTPEQLSLARPRGGDDRSDRYERERDNVTPRPDERGRAASRYNDSQGGRYEQESQKSARESFDSRMARRQPSPVRRREPTPPSRAATPPADTGEFGGW